MAVSRTTQRAKAGGDSGVGGLVVMIAIAIGGAYLISNMKGTPQRSVRY